MGNERRSEIKELLSKELTYEEWKNLASGGLFLFMLGSLVFLLYLPIAAIQNPMGWQAIALVSIMKIFEVLLFIGLVVFGSIAAISVLFLFYKILAGIPTHGKALWTELISDPETKQDDLVAIRESDGELPESAYHVS